jgi:hypothetical protein
MRKFFYQGPNMELLGVKILGTLGDALSVLVCIGAKLD